MQVQGAESVLPQKTAGKPLQLWHGPGNALRKSGEAIWEGVRTNAYSCAFVAAYSRADARRVIAAYLGRDIGDRELRDYWGNCTFSAMGGVLPERGLWVDVGKGPVKLG